ncbi:MAG: hypothetical protein DRQ43_08825, partial [Gammaproteobacteria bacterium]
GAFGAKDGDSEHHMDVLAASPGATTLPSEAWFNMIIPEYPLCCHLSQVHISVAVRNQNN